MQEYCRRTGISDSDESKERVSDLTAGVIFNLQRFSIHDGPGIRTTVFLKGCPLNCSWCHNPESQHPRPEVLFWSDRCSDCQRCLASCPAQAIVAPGQVDRERCSGCGRCASACPRAARELVGRVTSVDEVLAELQKDEVFYDQSAGGVTFSGGEPLAQPEFLQALLAGCKRCYWHTAVDTSGYAPWTLLSALLPLVDLWLYDLKLLDDAAHRQQTGVSNQLILQNLTRLLAAGANVEVRVPVVPGVNDRPGDWQALVAFLRPLAVRGVKLLGYHRYGQEKYRRLGLAYPLESTVPPSAERLAELSDYLQAAGLLVIR